MRTCACATTLHAPAHQVLSDLRVNPCRCTRNSSAWLSTTMPLRSHLRRCLVQPRVHLALGRHAITIARRQLGGAHDRRRWWWRWRRQWRGRRLVAWWLRRWVWLRLLWRLGDPEVAWGRWWRLVRTWRWRDACAWLDVWNAVDTVEGDAPPRGRRRRWRRRRPMWGRRRWRRRRWWRRPLLIWRHVNIVEFEQGWQDPYEVRVRHLLQHWWSDTH